MRRFRCLLFIFFDVSCLVSCSAQRSQVDLLVHNAKIYTVDESFSTAEAMVITNGKIKAIGEKKTLQKKYRAKNVVNAGGRFIYPGLIDAHAHFLKYGLFLQTVDLVGTSSWMEIIERLKAFAVTHTTGWLLGRGWDQNDWALKKFPDRALLDSLFPNRPVMLTRIDGHAVIVNAAAMHLAGLEIAEKINGGEVLEEKGRVTGVLIDNAIDLVNRKIPPASHHALVQALKEAQESCFAVGLTSIDDCGVDTGTVALVHQLQNSGELKMRLYLMLSDTKQNINYLVNKGIIKTDRLHVRSIKMYADGALGSRGACLLAPYSDQPGHVGFLLSDIRHFQEVAELMYKHGFQLCTHAIGDSGNRVVLDSYAKLLNKNDDRRWRIEHAQVVAVEDFAKFGQYGIIPSVQPTHATSDMYWAEERLGKDRIKQAYAFKQLLDQNGWMPLGTDFPIEDIHPMKTFYAAVARKDARGWPPGGYQLENALTRKEALRGMTIWAAKANFEEYEKGSLEVNKFADFIITDADLMEIATEKILTIQIWRTYLNGEKVFEQSKTK